MLKKPQKQPDLLPPAALAGLALQLGFAVATSAILFTYGGWWLDGQFDTRPIFFWLGITLGLLVSMVIVWQIVKPVRDQLNSPEKEKSIEK